MLGVYGKNHAPTGEAIFTLGFSGMINMKVWLATIAVLFALFQLGSALRLYGVYGSGTAQLGRNRHRVAATSPC